MKLYSRENLKKNIDTHFMTDASLQLLHHLRRDTSQIFCLCDFLLLKDTEFIVLIIHEEFMHARWNTSDLIFPLFQSC